MLSANNIQTHTLRDLLGMRGAALWLMLALVLVSIALLMSRNMDYTTAPLVTIAGFALIAGAGVLALCTPGDSVALVPTLAIVACCPAGVWLALSAEPAPMVRSYPAMSAYASSYVLPFLAIRGRVAWAWLSAALIGAVIAAVCGGDMNSPAIAGTLAPLGTLAGASALTLLLRPVQRTLLGLRDQATARAATEAMIAARRDESARQLARLNAIATPLLRQIARGAPLDSTEREECRLLEAELRDGLRAPQLAPSLATPARAARARGVDVVLLDDGGFAGVPDAARAAVIELAAAELTTATTGSVVIRVLPPRRQLLATVVVTEPGADRRTEVDSHGQVRMCPAY